MKELKDMTGIRYNIRYTRLQGFHIKLESINQNKLPVRSAVNEINTVILPHHCHRTPFISFT